MDGTVIPVVEGKLYALVNPYPLDGRPASHPLSARGFTTMNCFLLIGGSGALLFSTGYSVHQDSLLEQLAPLVGDRPLTLIIPRVEWASMCNARPIADRFSVATVYGHSTGLPSENLNFRPEFAGLDDDGLNNAEGLLLTASSAPVGDSGRELEFLRPQIRTLPSVWGYDHETKTLFTGDLFCWVWRNSAEGPWVLENTCEDPTDLDRVQESLVRNRYWWLAGANTDPLRRWINELFDEYEIETVAPDHGCLLRGEALSRHLQYLDEALAAVASMPSVGIAAASWPTVEVKS